MFYSRLGLFCAATLLALLSGLALTPLGSMSAVAAPADMSRRAFGVGVLAFAITPKILQEVSITLTDGEAAANRDLLWRANMIARDSLFGNRFASYVPTRTVGYSIGPELDLSDRIEWVRSTALRIAQLQSQLSSQFGPIDQIWEHIELMRGPAYPVWYLQDIPPTTRRFAKLGAEFETAYLEGLHKIDAGYAIGFERRMPKPKTEMEIYFDMSLGRGPSSEESVLTERDWRAKAWSERIDFKFSLFHAYQIEYPEEAARINTYKGDDVGPPYRFIQIPSDARLELSRKLSYQLADLEINLSKAQKIPLLQLVESIEAFQFPERDWVWDHRYKLRKYGQVDQRLLKQHLQAVRKIFPALAENIKRHIRTCEESAEYRYGDVERTLSGPDVQTKVEQDRQIHFPNYTIKTRRGLFERAGPEWLSSAEQHNVIAKFVDDLRERARPPIDKASPEAEQRPIAKSQDGVQLVRAVASVARNVLTNGTFKKSLQAGVVAGDTLPLSLNGEPRSACGRLLDSQQSSDAISSPIIESKAPIEEPLRPSK